MYNYHYNKNELSDYLLIKNIFIQFIFLNNQINLLKI